MRRGILISCFVLGAASAGALTVAMRAAPEDDPLRPAPAAVVAADKQVTTDTNAQQLQRWSETSLGRPLFAPDRRPSAAANAATQTAVLPRLSGIMTTSAGSRAIFAAVGAGKPEVVVEGSSVGGYLVQSIANGEVVLIGPDGRHSLRPSFDTAAAPPTTFVPPAAKEASP